MTYSHTEANLPVEDQYPKLVRDKIPEIIESSHKTATTHIAEEEEFLKHLFTKLFEEATELQQAVGSDHQKEELADVREVLCAIQDVLGFPEVELSAIQANKLMERGGFTDRIILDAKPE